MEIASRRGPSEHDPELAEVVTDAWRCLVKLPPAYARAAVLEMLGTEGAHGRVVMGPADIGGFDSLGPEEWAIIVSLASWFPDFHTDRHTGPLTTSDGAVARVFVFPKYTVGLSKTHARWLQLALERVKPERLDAEGKPLPWVPASPQRSRVEQPESGRDGDVEVIADGEPLPEVVAGDADDDDSSPVIGTEKIRARYRSLCARLELPCAELLVRRGRVERRGLVVGRVWITPGHEARRVTITTCPNSDLAEILSTLVHELAHVAHHARPGAAHDLPFRETMVSLASRAWGAPYLAAARAHLAESYQVVDRWLSSGIRAALAKAAPPARRTGDDGHTARVIGKIAKLRALAADQVGKPEAIAATATANDLVTFYGLGAYDVELDPGIHDGLVDRWVLLERGKPWQRALAHHVAKFNGVFSLYVGTFGSHARMHFFGRYPNVVAAEYLYSISAERIARERDAYLKERRGRPGRRAATARQEAVAFCDSAVRAFGVKLEQAAAGMRATHGNGDLAVPAAAELAEAEEFARREYDKRGFSWGSGPRRKTRQSEAGEEAGRRLPIVQGLDADGQARRLLRSGPRQNY